MIRDAKAEKLPVPNDRGKINVLRKIEESSDKIDDEPEPLQNEDYIASQAEALKAVEKAFIEDKKLYGKLCGFAKKILIQLDFNDTLLRLGEDNIVGMLTEKIASGVRKWHKHQQPNIVAFMRMAIVSIIKDELKIKKQIKCVPLNEMYKSACDLEEEQEKLRNNYDIENINMIDIEINSTAENKLMNNCVSAPSDTESEDSEYIISKFERELEDDMEAYYVLQERLAGVRSNQEIARELGMTVKEVENGLKRIKRKFISSKNKVKKIKKIK